MRANLLRLLLAKRGEFLVEYGLIARGLDDRPRAGEHRTAARTTVHAAVLARRRSRTPSPAVALSLSILLPCRATPAGAAPSGAETHTAPRRHPHGHAR